MRICPKKILCAIDFSTFTDSIVAAGVLLGKLYSAKLLLVHVTIDVTNLLEHHETALDVTALHQTNIREAKKLLEELAGKVPLENGVIIGQGAPADEIGRIAEEQEADLVITATHGRSGFKRFLLGSVTEKLMKTLPCPLLVLPSHAEASRLRDGEKISKMLVGCDFSPDSYFAVEYALGLVKEFKSALYLAHIIKPSLYRDQREASDELRGRLRKRLEDMVPEVYRAGSNVKTVLIEGQPSLELMKYADGHAIDMIVLGIHGHKLIEKLLVGSTTDRVIRQTNLPVLAVRRP